MSTRVLICDDHPVFRDGLSAMLSSSGGFEVVGEAADGLEAEERAAALKPDVVVMDLNMPGLDGFEAIRRIRARDEQARILVLTMLEDDDSVFASMRAGALGYVLKGADKDQIRRAVNSVARGEAIFGPAIASRVIAFFTTGHRRGPVPFPELTEREREVLEHASQGSRNAAIARRLGISEKTVRNHVSNIFVKLQVADRAEMVAKARDAGIGERPD
jgi:DNA-binding NarL/FixJ family response regulator